MFSVFNFFPEFQSYQQSQGIDREVYLREQVEKRSAKEAQLLGAVHICA